MKLTLKAKRVFSAAVLVLVAARVLIPAGSAWAHSPGTGGWYWPVGTERFSMSGWWDQRGSHWHMAQDMGAPAGRRVYAIADGEVLESKYVAHYGPGGGQGGAVVILHKTFDGVEFKALYGHVSNLRYKKGDRVKAGAVIATVNRSSPNHLHFGIHPGRAYPSDNNPFRGHTYTSRNTYGWVNPVRFLKTNYRVDPYRAPALETVDVVETSATPAWTRACGGSLWWGYAAPTDEATWTCSIPDGPVRAADASECVPAHDGVRYALAVAGSRINVQDRLPRMGLYLSDVDPPPGAPIVLSGLVRNSAKQPFQHAGISVERWTGSAWVRIATVYTSPSGTWTRRYVPPRGRSAYRARFVPPRIYSAGVSRSLRVVTTP